MFNGDAKLIEVEGRSSLPHQFYIWAGQKSWRVAYSRRLRLAECACAFVAIYYRSTQYSSNEIRVLLAARIIRFALQRDGRSFFWGECHVVTYMRVVLQ